MPAPPTLRPPPATPPSTAPLGLSELEVRRRVERLFARELAEPSEELVRFVSARLEDAAAEPAAGQLSEMCRHALRELGRERWHSAAARPFRRDLDRRLLDRRRFEQQRALPGYYLG